MTNATDQKIYNLPNLQLLYTMISKIESLTAFCNKLAQDLSKKEVQENQIHIDYGLKGPYMSLLIMGQLDQTNIQNLALNPNILSLCSPAEVALQMVEISFKISSLYYTRVGLASNFEGIKEGTELKIEQQDLISKQKCVTKVKDNDNDLGDQSESEQSKPMLLLKMMKMVKENKMKYSQAKMILKTMKIDDGMAQRWMNIQENKQKSHYLKEEVLKHAGDGKMTMNEFKKIARKVCTHRLFRPTESWCINIIQKLKLTGLVQLPEQNE